MKKTLVLLIFVLSVLTLAGCQAEEPELIDTVKPVISGTTDFNLILGDEAPNWLDGVSATDDVDGSIDVVVDDSDLNLDEAGIYDVIYMATDEAGNTQTVTITVTIDDPEVYAFYVSLTDLDGTKLINETITFDTELETPIVELINGVVDLDYTVFDFGTMINGIGGHYPKEYGASYNYYYQIIVDGTPIMTGIDQVAYTDDMMIEFVETSTLSELDQKVDDFIYDFIENHMDGYLVDQNPDYYVLTAGYQLYQKGYITTNITESYVYDPVEITETYLSELTVGQLLRLSLFMKIEGWDLTAVKDYLLTLEVTNPYEITSYLQALMIVGERNETLALELIQNDFLDPDFVGMSYSGLYGYEALEGFDTYLSDAYTYLSDALSEDGIISWGNANAASTATIILGLIAQGINPEDEAYQTNGVGLIEALMAYEIDGTFKWMLTDENADLMFSTPQAFHALVAYKLARDIWGFPATHLFDLN